MYLLIKKGRLYKESKKNTSNIEALGAFGRKWETITHSKEDKELSSIWDRESRYMLLKKSRFGDGLYYLLSGGKFRLILPVKTW